MHQKQTPDDTLGGSTAPSAYRAPTGSNARAPGEPMVLPPHTTFERFETFIRRAGEVCGVGNVTIISDDAEIQNEDYTTPSKAHDMFHIVDKEHFLASAVIAPRSVPDVQDVIKLCNEFEIPVWPFSVGRNVGYGGAAPRVPGCVGLDLGRNINKILKVDVDGAYAVVEPGVTFL